MDSTSNGAMPGPASVRAVGTVLVIQNLVKRICEGMAAAAATAAGEPGAVAAMAREGVLAAVAGTYATPPAPAGDGSSGPTPAPPAAMPPPMLLRPLRKVASEPADGERGALLPLVVLSSRRVAADVDTADDADAAVACALAATAAGAGAGAVDAAKATGFGGRPAGPLVALAEASTVLPLTTGAVASGSATNPVAVDELSPAAAAAATFAEAAAGLSGGRGASAGAGGPASAAWAAWAACAACAALAGLPAALGAGNAPPSWLARRANACPGPNPDPWPGAGGPLACPAEAGGGTLQPVAGAPCPCTALPALWVWAMETAPLPWPGRGDPRVNLRQLSLGKTACVT